MFMKKIIEKSQGSRPEWHELLKYVDIMVDGPFIEEQRNLLLKFRGSENQRVIDIRKSLECGNVIVL